ncbi:MAG: phytanoyl-CoA dioxygenase family protein [Gammaproteobacteria bacterium]
MAKILSVAARSQYQRDGYYFPLDVLSPAEVTERRTRLEGFERAQGHPIVGPQRSKSHVLFTWVDELIRHPRILDAVEDLIGPDILCWNTVWWIKEPMSDTYVSWHQDLRYVGLDCNEFVTAWLALSPATVESGCMRILPGSHQDEIMPHHDKYNEDNLLTRGQEISVPVDESRAVAMELAPGQISLHNVRLAHASTPNRSHDRRIGLSMHYIPPSARQLSVDWDSASLVRGEDRFHHFTPTPRPVRDLDPDAVRFHEQATDAFRAIVFKDAERVRPRL